MLAIQGLAEEAISQLKRNPESLAGSSFPRSHRYILHVSNDYPNLEHALRVMDGLGLTMLVVPKAHAPWLEQAAAHAASIGEEAVWEPHA